MSGECTVITATATAIRNNNNNNGNSANVLNYRLPQCMRCKCDRNLRLFVPHLFVVAVVVVVLNRKQNFKFSLLL